MSLFRYNSSASLRALGIRRLVVRLLQLNVKARLAHSACFAAVTLQEVMTAGRTIEIRTVHRMAV
ncbi:MAG: hypothetical protein WAN72_08430 [Candidatus Acidiferrales bacterium]